MLVLDNYLINHILSFRPPHPISVIIKKFVKIQSVWLCNQNYKLTSFKTFMFYYLKQDKDIKIWMYDFYSK